MSSNDSAVRAGRGPSARFRARFAGGVRGPFTRWPRTADAALAVLAFCLTVFFVDGPGDSTVFRAVDEVPVFALAAIAVASGALWWRRRSPFAVLGIALVLWGAVTGYSGSEPGWAAVIALYSAGRYARSVRWGVAGVAAVVALVSVSAWRSGGDRWWEDTVIGSVILFGVWYVGRVLRLRRLRAADRVREREAEVLRIAAEERTRIARELHDVVAHRVSLMTVQARGARAVAAEDPAAAVEAMGAVEDAGRQALAELRHLLGVLRPAEGDLDLGPQPGLAALPRLVEQMREAGVGVALDAKGLPELPGRTELSAYRIVQESLTNVLKHAGPGARAEVRLSVDREALVIEVRDDGLGSEPSQDATTGHGLIGLRERASLLGGSLRAGPRPEGGFEVAARLPLGGRAA
ncbi:sensor histidine kinase [Glycomyces harbinensis]|uniref:histidine kinase n=1 Tax=Glycomyces harbinensis TaxID=58114 RepID=A0A1G6XDL8_9ACTN|nr:sensor histidine kinase [Glycomyces harbinensis]SDD76334.1 Signal transduction histidine kinase [Glycomyces harbinensis]